MLPTWLASRYRQYKADTNSIAKWLAETAQQHGFDDAGILPDIPRKLNRTRSSKRASKTQAKRGQALFETKTHIISTRKFVTLARYIALSAKNGARVPRALIATVKRVIKARKCSNDFYKQQENPDLSDGEGHAYFVTVLEEVLQILTPLCDQDLKQEHGGGTATPHDPIENAFSNLAVDEPSEDFLDADVVETSVSQPDIKYEAESLDEAQALVLAVFCLFSDLNDIRKLLQRLWQDNKTGSVDLVTAALCTNTAIDLVRRMQEDIEKEFPNQKNFEDLIRLFYASQCLAKGHDPAFKEAEDDTFNLACYDLADWLFLPAYSQLNSFAAFVEKNRLYVYKAGSLGDYDPLADRTAMSDREKYHEDRVILLAILADFCFVAQTNKEIPAEDELTRGLRGLFETKQIPLWLVFAAQNFLDIHHIFRQDVGVALTTLQQTGKRAKTTVERTLLFHKDLTVANWPRQNDDRLRSLILFIDEWSQKDAIAKIRKKVYEKNPGPCSSQTQPDFYLLRNHPLLCGLSCYSIQIQIQEVAILFLGAWGSVMAAGHLYNAVRQEQFCQREWPDMQRLFEIHTSSQFFDGRFPNNAFDYLKQFQVWMGQTASSFAGRVIHSEDGPKSLRPPCPVLDLFKARYCDNANELDLNLASIEQILSEQFSVDTIGGPNESVKTTAREPDGTSSSTKAAKGGKRSKKVNRHNSKSSRESRSSRFQKTNALSPYELLVVLQMAVEDELPSLNFDYLCFHRICWTLLRNVRRAVHTQILKLGCENYLEGEHQLPFILGYMFDIAFQSRRIAEMAGIHKPGPRGTPGAKVDSKILMIAGQTVEKFLGGR